jgi:hypothetical protein
MADGLRGISSVAELLDLDAANFLLGLKKALEETPALKTPDIAMQIWKNIGRITKNPTSNIFEP